VQRRRSDPERRRRQRAHKQARSRVRKALREDRGAAAAGIDAAMRTFLDERAGIPGGALSPEELAEATRAAGAGEETTATLERWLTDLAAVRYAGRAEPSIEILADRATALLDDLSEELP